MEYRAVISQLKQFRRLGINLGLQRITDLLRILGQPQRNFPVVHIGGTNGKGSTTMILASILEAAGYRVGVFSSPHLSSYCERLMLNGVQISEARFAALFTQVCETLPEVLRDTGENPTEFEILTAMSFLFFSQEKVDLALLEVGLGGNIDSTNIVEKPLLSIITNVSFDHQDRLGNTLSEIAAKKSGIIKKGCPVVTACKGEDVLQIVRQKAQKMKAPLREIWSEVVWSGEPAGLAGQYLRLQTKEADYQQLFLPLQGEYQLENAITAIVAGEVLQKQGWSIGLAAIKQGLAKVKWPGRLELIGKNPLFVLDGAHNLAGFMALAQWLIQKKQARQQIILVIGMLDGKDRVWASHWLKPLVNKVIITKPNSERTKDWQDLQDHFQGDLPLFCLADLAEALKKARAEAGPEDLVLVTGSLHLLGQAREILQKQEV